MRILLCLLVVSFCGLVQACNYRAYDYKPFPLIEEVISKCNLKSIVDWECYWNVKERITCHSCVLEHIRVKCPRLPDYIEWTEEVDCRRLRECIYNLDFKQCYG